MTVINLIGGVILLAYVAYCEFLKRVWLPKLIIKYCESQDHMMQQKVDIWINKKKLLQESKTIYMYGIIGVVMIFLALMNIVTSLFI